MARGAERDALEARITELEGEVTLLRSTLANIAHEVADAIQRPVGSSSNDAGQTGPVE